LVLDLGEISEDEICPHFAVHPDELSAEKACARGVLPDARYTSVVAGNPGACGGRTGKNT